MIPPPPRSTLFPYTTLFRSTPGASPRWATARSREPTTHPRRRAPGVDRKSTRLNSSHGSISYAVFCLKKNKRDQPYAGERDNHDLSTPTDTTSNHSTRQQYV